MKLQLRNGEIFNQKDNIKISDNNFNHLISNLNRDFRNNPFIKINQGKEVIFRLRNRNYKSWLKFTILEDTRLIIEPKISGIGIAMQYEGGFLKNAISRNGIDQIKRIELVENVPKKIPIKNDLYIRGELYSKGFSSYESKKRTRRYLVSKMQKIESINFSAFQIINSNLNHLSQIKQLKRLGFEVPKNEYTKSRTSEVEIYKNLWEKGFLFKEYPTSGIVLKVNSRKLQKQLEENCIYPLWAYIIKE